eukprot:GHVH01012164.1.p1 GENE.GHVH01012164.1~~GHVH01012164.1.p1  ORF type:complete len:143 (+),score=21.24 GHVH01012164.1:44-430(+)
MSTNNEMEVQRQKQKADMLTPVINELRKTKSHFARSSETVQSTLIAKNKGTTVMAQITPSLYVDAPLSCIDRVSIDLGVGFYAEVGRDYAIKYLDRKVREIDENITTLTEAQEIEKKKVVELMSKKAE